MSTLFFYSLLSAYKVGYYILSYLHYPLFYIIMGQFDLIRTGDKIVSQLTYL